MKKLFFVLLLISITSNAQSWNSIITTNINISDADYMENYANKNGIHVVTHEEYSNDIKYYLISSAGATIRSATISTDGEFPNIVGDASNIYVVYKEGSNIRIKKSTDAGVNWTNKSDLPIGTDVCGGVDASINTDGIHTVWAIGDYVSETNYKKYSIANNNWVDFYNVTNYSGGYGTTPTVSVSPSRVHVGYNSNNAYDPPYFAFDANEMSRTKYNTTWQTQQQVATNESSLGKIFAASSKLYDFYYDYYSAGLGQFGHDLYFKYRTIGSTSWSSSTQFEVNADVTQPLTICETADGNVHGFTYQPAVGLTERIIINGAINSSATISSNGSVLAYDVNSVYNDVYVNWRTNYSAYLQLRQFDTAPAKPQTLNSSSYNNHPKLYWNASNEPDIDFYRVYKDGAFIATTSNTYYIDNSETIYFPGLGNVKTYVQYKIKAVDKSNYYSEYSDSKSVAVNGSGSADKIAYEEELASNITTYELNSNYPNPFNPSTQISYQIPADGFVNLIVYNMLGQEVAQLVNQNQSMGKYSVKFNASNLPSGVYIYKLHVSASPTTSFSDVKKMLLTK